MGLRRLGTPCLRPGCGDWTVHTCSSALAIRRPGSAGIEGFRSRDDFFSQAEDLAIISARGQSAAVGTARADAAESLGRLLGPILPVLQRRRGALLLGT